MRFRYPQPGNKDEFEDFCVRFYRHLLKRNGLVRYAKSGETQDGIDIIDQWGMKPLIVIQCKNHEPTKTVPPKEINDEVSLAESSIHPIDRYIIATTAKKTRNAQDTVLQLNQSNSGSRQFTVEIHFWEDICSHLDEFGKAVADFIVFGERPSEDSDQALQFGHGSKAPVTTVTTASASETEDTGCFLEIDLLFKERKLEAAEHEIRKLPDPEQDQALGTRQRYAILRLRAKLAMERFHFDEAVRLFNLAYDTCPDLQQARQNRVLALEFSGDHRSAFSEAEQLLAEGMQSSFLVSLLIRNATAASDLLPHQATIDNTVWRKTSTSRSPASTWTGASSRWQGMLPEGLSQLHQSQRMHSSRAAWLLTNLACKAIGDSATTCLKRPIVITHPQLLQRNVTSTLDCCRKSIPIAVECVPSLVGVTKRPMIFAPLYVFQASRAFTQKSPLHFSFMNRTLILRGQCSRFWMAHPVKRRTCQP